MTRVVISRSRWTLALALLGASSAASFVTPNPARAQGVKLGTDDVIAVQVVNHPEMSAPELSIGPNGKVALPLIGDLSVTGMTQAQAQTAITNAFRKQLRAPHVSVTIVRTHPKQIIALGAVVKPGAVDIQPNWRVSELLAAAGGTSLPLESVTATLTHPKMKPIALDLVRIMASPDDPSNKKVMVGDVFNVAAIPVSHITISGDVKTPGTITLRKTPRAPRAFDAILAAGNLIARPEEMHGYLLRGGSKKATLDLPAIFADSKSDANLYLQDGDLLTLETVHTNISVVSFDNLVKAPGPYIFGDDVTAVSALVKAGGLTVEPQNVVATVRRGNEILPVNLERAVYDPSNDVRMKEGDMLLLAFPEGPQVTITGAVAKPGPLRVKVGTTLIDAVVQAGGLTFKPDQVRLSILRTLPTGKQVTLDIDPVKLFDLRDLGQNVVMQQGDLVVINQGAVSQSVFVSGEVANKGSYEVSPRDSLPEVILRAGGPTKMALLSQVSVTRRDGTTQLVDVSGSLKAGGPKLNFPLQEGDIVVVPAIQRRVLVMNAVVNPGYYPLPEGGTLTLGDAILAAGGARVGAKLKEVAILHRNPEGTVDKRIVSIADVQNGAMNIDVPLRDGDVVYVPEGKAGGGGIRAFGQTLATATTLLRLGTFF